MLMQGPTLHHAACKWITKYDGYTPAKRFPQQFFSDHLCLAVHSGIISDHVWKSNAPSGKYQVYQ